MSILGWALPEELETVLLEFALHHEKDQPKDIIAYATDYFQRLRKTRRALLILGEDPNTVSSASLTEDEKEEVINLYEKRRSGVAAENYDPENDDDDREDAYYPKTEYERVFLLDSIQKLLLFSTLPQSEMERVVNAMFKLEVSASKVVIEQGEDADNFYVIEKGIYHAYISTTPTLPATLVHTYNNRGYFGELALLYNQPRSATIKAVTDGSLWALSRPDFRRIVLKSTYKKRKMYENFLEEVPLLQNIKPYDRMNLADALIPKTFENGDCIIAQGEEGDGMYFIEDGTVTVTVVTDDGDEKEITRLGKRDYFGELALITNRPRAASVYACDNVKVAFLEVDAFERLLGPCVEVLHENIPKYEAALIELDRKNLSFHSVII